jgi:hypothetical protein
MNTKSINNRVARILAVAFLAIVVIFSNPLTSRANGGGGKSRAASEEQFSVKFQSSTDKDITFHVDYENPTGEKFALIVKNDNGDVVFSQTFTDTHFSRSVVIENTESDIQPTFVIRTANTELSRQFQVSTTLTSTITVTKL